MSSQQSKFSISVRGIYNPVKCLNFIKSGFIGQGFDVGIGENNWMSVYCFEQVEETVGIIRRTKQFKSVKRRVAAIREYDNDYHKTKTITVNLFDQSMENLVHKLLKEYLEHLSRKYEEVSSQGIISDIPAVNIVWNDLTTRKTE